MGKVATDRVARYLEWTSTVQSEKGRTQFLQDLKSHGDIAKYAKALDLPNERVAAFLVEHADLNDQAKEAVLWYTHQLAADVISIADELVTEPDAERREILKAAAKFRTEARKWIASKWNRPDYGDSVVVQHQGETVVRLTFGERTVAAEPALVGQSTLVDEEDVGI